MVGITDEGELVAAFYCPLPSQYPQTAQAGEHYAILMALRQMAGNETIYSDCSGVVDGFAKGRQLTMRPECFHASIWELIWDILDPGHEVSVTKVKAHKSEAACKGDPGQRGS